jgi:hypothetical protein
MKTQIIQLEPHDDIISTRDKMGWGQAARIVLVWPKRERILARKLDLLLLNRHAVKMGAQLALVTDDPDVRHNARQLAIPVFKNQRLARNPRWRVGKRLPRSIERRRPRPDLSTLRQEIRPTQTAWYNLPNARRGFHAVSIFAALVLLAIMIPAASIRLHPVTHTQELRFPVSARPSASTIELSGDLPAQYINFFVEGHQEISASGNMAVPEKSSFGRVEFTNLTDKVVKIPTGLVVATIPDDGQQAIRFSTTISMDVAEGGTARISIRCLVSGKVGNVRASEIKAIEGPLGLSLSVTNPTPMTGGSEQLVKVPTPQDARRLHDHLYASLQKAAERQLVEGNLVPDGFPIESSLNLVSVLEETYDPSLQEGVFTQPADRLGLTMRMEFKGLYVSNKDLHDMATRILDANLQQGYRPLPVTLELEHISDPIIYEDLTAHWRIEARRTIQAIIEEQQVQELVRGQTPIQAASALQAKLPINGDAHIQLAPQWWPRLPILPFRIEVSTP